MATPQTQIREVPMEDQVLERIITGEAMQQVSPEEFFQTQYTIYSLLKDEIVQQQLLDDPDAKVLIPALSHLVRTTNIENPTAVQYLLLTWEIACRLVFLVYKPPNLINRAKFEAWNIFGRGVIHDAEHGWRGKLVTERIKIYKVEGAEKKRRKLLGIF